ncbi:MAG: alpha/beta fold hydrolase [Acidobacteriota bacterium]
MRAIFRPMARSLEEEQRRRRRRRLIQGLLLGSAAVGVPALINAAVARRARRVPETTWGSRDSCSWRGAEIAYQRLGSGEPLVLLHSFGAGHSSAEWRQVAERLASSFEVFAPDLPGWGHSSGPPEASPSPSLYAEWLEDFLGRVIGRPAVLVAAGPSGCYAARAAADLPERVRCLALVVPSGLSPRGKRRGDAVLHRLLRLPILGTSALNLYTSRGSIAGSLRGEVYASPHQVDDALVDLHYAHAHRPGRQRWLAAYLSGALDDPGARRVLGRIRQPTWLAWGRMAAAGGVTSAHPWLSRLPRGELEIFEQAGSLPHAESPGEFARKLENFLLESEPSADPSRTDGPRSQRASALATGES